MTPRRELIAGIEVLTCLDAIRARPRLHVGGSGPSALWQLVKIVLDYSIGTDGPIPSGSRHVEIALMSDGGIGVNGDGCGFPVEPSGLFGCENEPWLTVAFTTLSVPADFPGAYLVVVNALSSLLIASAKRGSRTDTVRFEDGVQDGPVYHGTIVGATAPLSTSIHFWPLPEIVGEEFDRLYFNEQLAAYAAVHPQVEFTVVDHDIDAFESAVASAEQVIVRMSGVYTREASTDPGVLFTTPADVTELRRLLAVEVVLDAYCMCSGQLALAFIDKEGARLASATIHHGTHIRWEGWSGDGWLADGKALMAWLDAHGVPDPERLASDATTYSVWLNQSETPDARLVQLIHQRLSIGLGKAREMIHAADVLFLEGKATAAFNAQRELDALGYRYHITPDFSYEQLSATGRQ